MGYLKDPYYDSAKASESTQETRNAEVRMVDTMERQSSQIEKEVYRLEKFIADVSNAVEMLEAKFAAVMRAEADVDGRTIEPAKEERLVPLADVLNQFNIQLSRIAYRLNLMYDRCEL